MDLTEHHIEFQKTGRYFVQGELSDGKELIIALHGYGHLAEFFIKKFQALDSSKYVVVCPEGLNRYYQNGTGGRVGASWMTKEDREHDIKDYISFLDTLLDSLNAKYSFSKTTLLGFSQGGATASRWLAHGNHDFETFILWATVFPPDMEKKYTSKFMASRNYFVFGNEDEYYSQEIVKEHYRAFDGLRLNFQMINFDGKHNIHYESLLKILEDA
ncbi:MAG: putative esterase [Arenicella sp.]|jgi:predicted esterase